MSDNYYTVGLDFDGTCVKHKFPHLGEDVPHCVRVLHWLKTQNALFILNSMRSGSQLQDALNWFSARRIELYGINHHPKQREWTSSPKVLADLYIDDLALGIPLIIEDGHRPYVDWIGVENLLKTTRINVIPMI